VKQSPTVFIINDRQQILESLEAIFILHGYTVECFGSSAEFIGSQRPNETGCVIVDPQMNPDGRAVLQWLYKSDSLLSAVLISGLSDNTGAGGPSQIGDAPYEVWTLLTMVADGLAGSLSRKFIRDRGGMRG
jgi:DNA-binding NtrC family response regulator